MQEGQESRKYAGGGMESRKDAGEGGESIGRGQSSGQNQTILIRVGDHSGEGILITSHFERGGGGGRMVRVLH